ncbi:hypothetical protein [Roseiflexus sp.]|uniref:hypothetical protein n=1 Tax=Roseiflexus sp. TaxID=2562120 RepID=UPI0021DCD996|nr:hypothetical protein [Roseiflexus sp.]GIW02052.1 MAG: hypothetical protein KatS3mg058_3455 [Roseiflexus sp.]
MAAVVHMQVSMRHKIVGGVVGGLAGGVVFGALMGMMGMLPMVASLVGGNDALIGFLVHIVISAVIGAGFGLIFGPRSTHFGQGALWGLVYGAIWWVLGPLVIMPSMMGMGVQFGAALSVPMLMSLMGHLLYGVIAGLVFAWFIKHGTGWEG